MSDGSTGTTGSRLQNAIATSLVALMVVGCPSAALEPQVVAPVHLNWGDDKPLKDQSGVGIVGRFLLICGDESKHAVSVLEAQNGGYRYLRQIRLTNNNDELDLEGIACDGNTVYVTGSHSRDKDNNRQESRERVFKFDLGDDGKLKGDVTSTSLRKAIVANPALEPATHKRPKEGGLDIEGLAFRDGWLYAGFRGPLDRSDALVMKFRFADPTGTEQLLKVDLGGLGIRDLTRVSDGFLILAGPMDTADGPYQLHHWNGQAVGRTRRLCTIPSPNGDKPEGLAVLREDADGYEFLILFDRKENGDPKRYRIKK